MALLELIASNAAAALAVVSKYVGQSTVAGVLIETNRFERTIDSEVSEHVLIDLNKGLQFVNDNVAPGPRTWEIEGFIGGLSPELSNRFMPSLLVMIMTLDAAAQSRDTVPLKDTNGRFWDVVIKRFWYATQPDVQNRVPVRLTLIEMYKLSATINAQTPQQTGSPALGTQQGSPVPMGSAESSQASTGIPASLLAPQEGF